MAHSKVINQQSFHDGRVVLYQLENRPKKLWLCRIKVPGGTGYIYRGTGTSDLYEARKFADDLVDEIRLKIKLGQSVTGPSFAEMIDDYETFINARASGPTRQERAILAFLKTYALPYFRKSKIAEVNPKLIDQFFDWRRQNSTKGKAPRETTILHETSLFSSFLRWCHRRGHIDREVHINRPKQDGKRRPHFDKKDWQKLLRFLPKWISDGKGLAPRIHRSRLLLAHYIAILGCTGIRVGEARGLRWQDIDTEPSDEAGIVHVILHVKGKTGIREVVSSTPLLKDSLSILWKHRLKELGHKPSLTEPIFCHEDGSPIGSFKKGFETVLKEAGIEYDRYGEKRTIYSLRHTYATFQLQDGVNHYALARNMGTSIKMLEQFYGHVANRAMASELAKPAKKKATSDMPWEE